MSLEEILKAKLGKTELSVSEVLELQKTESMVRAYCNLTDDEFLPEALKFAIAESAADILTEASEESRKLKSISMGDTSYSFQGTSDKLRTEKLEMRGEVLRRYRKLKK